MRTHLPWWRDHAPACGKPDLCRQPLGGPLAEEMKGTCPPSWRPTPGTCWAKAALHRMTDRTARRALYNTPGLEGWSTTLQFCDYYGFEYAGLRSRLPMPC